jgi:RTX calcium-binding nonapeptide repeat (4 copies)
MRTAENAAVSSTSCRASLLAAVGVAFLLALSPEAEGRVRCAYAGAPQNLLTVTADRDASGEITRPGPITTTGQEIWVREFLDPPRPCRGGVPTVLNTDTIRVLSRGGISVGDVLLALGPFAPGATPELEGASEIEIEFTFRLSSLWAAVSGTRRADEFHWGPGPQHHPGLNLNPRDAGDQDVDVTVRGRGAYLIAGGAAGNDTIVPAPGAPFPNDGVVSAGGRGDDRLSAPRNSWGSLGGGAGDDVLTGGRQRDFLFGGDGNDHLRGTAGADLLSGGSGRDMIFGGRGRDRINSRDSRRDTIRCGAGADRAKADRQDRLRGCEVIRRR